MALATDLIDDSFKKTKQRFLPFSKEWFKLGLVSLLSSSGGGGGNFSNISNVSDLPGVKDFVKNNLGFILTGAGIATLVGLLWRIITLTFTFIFIDSVITSKTRIKEGFKKHINKGVSVFLLLLLIGLGNLILLGLVSLPILIPLIKNFQNLSIDHFSIPYIIFFAVFFVLDIIVFGLINWFIGNLVIYDMYRKNNFVIDSMKRGLYLLKNDFVEVLVFFLMKIVLGIGAGLIIMLVFFILLIPFGLIGVIFVILFVWLIAAGSVATLLWIIPAIIIGLILLLLFSYTLNVAVLPVNGFFINYTYNFVNELSKRHKM